ncbi:MAG: chemotaxis protein CheD [Proteobacteria bacterium]|nr:chemotaxis protein CheD [Pseudomonadota bacterium]
MSLNIIGIGEFGASNTVGTTIKTLALGSCVAVILLHPPTRSVGMVHVALPDSSISPERAQERPGYFADTGIPALLRSMTQLGCNHNGKEYIVKLAGGAKVMDPNNTFNIGKRNALAIKKILWKYGLGAVAEDLGGHFSRTVAVHVDTGRVVLSSSGRPDWEI